MKRRLRSVGLLILFLALLVLPSLARAGYYYRRVYVPPVVPRPDHGLVDLPTVGASAFDDVDVRQSSGKVIVDRIHDNAVEDVELNVLLSRFTTRGLETVPNLDPSSGSDGSWVDMLRTAVALVVVSPHEQFSAEEIEAVSRFVERGGRVLLVGDPSRYSLRQEVDEIYGEFIVPESDVAALNSLAAPFGLAFADDYIYNTTENAGNYQYVFLRDFSRRGQERLTAGLQEVVFYAAHSITADEEALITADSDTASSLSEQTGGVATVSLGGGGRVLAVGDFTFMTEPYNSTADNNRLIANIADFVAGALRTYDLTEFPGFFGDEVDLVSLVNPSGEDALRATAVAQASNLQLAFESADKRLHWRTRPDAGRDTLYVGSYEGLWFWPQVSEILASQGISFTLETIEQELATPTPTPRYPPTATPTPRVSPTPSPTPRPLRDWIHFPGLGRVEAKETSLFYHDEQDGRHVLVVLAFSEEGLALAFQRLIEGTYADCLLDQDQDGEPGLVDLALCPTAYEPPEEQPTPVPTPEDGSDLLPAPVAEGSILIVADDDGEAAYEQWTSAYDFFDIATNAGYQPVPWSTSVDGEVTLEQMQSYDAVIWCTGDYHEDGIAPEEGDLSNLMAYLGGDGRAILSGAFIGDPRESESGPLLDIQVVQADHPLAEGFEADQVLALQRFTAEEDYAAYVLSETDPASIVFARGPESEFPGKAVLSVDQDEGSGSRSIWIGFPIFLLPYEDEVQLGTNAVRWLMGE